jgi:hypothetical protein
MNTRSLESWWNRPTYSTVKTLCAECNRLREDVKKRQYVIGFTAHETECCAECVAELSNHAGIVVC